MDLPLCTLNGFTGARNGEMIPEWRVKKNNTVTLEKGSELHQVIDGKDAIIGIFDVKHFK